jgi:predicted transglutaminase-like cysteine proteinase
MRRARELVIPIIAVAAIFSFPHAHAAFYAFPLSLKPQIDRVRIAEPALTPMAHTNFCLQYAADCEVRRMPFRGRGIAMDAKRWSEIVAVNAQVNRSIRPERNQGGVGAERWVLYPKSGDCNDDAVTKRHELLMRGWPSAALLLAHVQTRWGEHHLVLVVRTRDGDLVLDNLNAGVQHWSQTRYRWLRIQSPTNPKYWSTVAPVAA